MRNCELVKRREQEENKVTLEELEDQHVKAMEVVEKERETVEQERAVYNNIADKISKRHMSHNSYTGLLNTLTQRNSRVIYMMPCTFSMMSSQQR